jgi:hypothetical protein
MICPQTKSECPHESCCGRQCFKQLRDDILSDGKSPKPDMAEIERLLTDTEESWFNYGLFVHDRQDRERYKKEAVTRRAALIAAIERMK